MENENVMGHWSYIFYSLWRIFVILPSKIAEMQIAAPNILIAVIWAPKFIKMLILAAKIVKMNILVPKIANIDEKSRHGPN